MTTLCGCWLVCSFCEGRDKPNCCYNTRKKKKMNDITQTPELVDAKLIGEDNTTPETETIFIAPVDADHVVAPNS